MHVSAEEVRAAHTLTSVALAAIILVGFVPGLRAHAGRIRVIIAIGYIAAAIAFMLYLLVR